MPLPFTLYDQRHYRTVDVVTGYREWADLYDARQPAELDLDLLQQVESIRWQTSQNIIDLACGTGRTGAWLLVQGAQQLHGVDLSAEMLAHAAPKNIYTTLTRASMAALPHPAAAFAGGLTVLAADHLPDLHPLFQEAQRVIQRAGFFVLVDYHPFFLLKGIPTHFPTAKGEQLAIVNYVHLISDYLNAAHAANWELIETHERLVDDKWIARMPAMSKYANEPISFVMVWRLK